MKTNNPFGALLESPRGVTQVENYVNMHVQGFLKWTHISEVHFDRITTISIKKDTLISDLLRFELHAEKNTLF